MTPQISILLPVFNGQQYLQECIQSVLQQDLSNFELIIGDDHSTDNSSIIIQNFSDVRIRYYRWEKNLGLFPNLNRLLPLAQAPVIRLLGQDDLLENTCLRQEVDFFAIHPNIGMSFCKSISIDADGNETSRGALNDMPDIVPPYLSMQLFYYFGCITGNICTVCMRRECFDSIGCFDESFKVANDYELWSRICQHKDLGVIHKHLVRLRVHKKQLSQSSKSGVLFVAENRRIRNQILPLLPQGIRVFAQRYVRRRQNVLDTHYAIRCLLHGRYKDCYDIACTLGLQDWITGLFYWFITGNNYWLKPAPQIVQST